MQWYPTTSAVCCAAVYHVPEQHDGCKRRLCGVQRQKEAQEAQAAQEARHEQAKRRAKLEAGFAEVSATALMKQQWLMTAAYDCCPIPVHDCCSIRCFVCIAMIVLHAYVDSCLCYCTSHKTGRALLNLTCISLVG